MSTHTDICLPEGSLSIVPQNFCSTANVNSLNPIDEFATLLKDIMPLATPDALATNAALGRLLFLGIVSITEQYFRSIIASVVHLCPLCREHSSSHVLSFGAVEYYGMDRLAHGLLEGITFSTTGVVASTTSKLLGMSITGNSFQTAITEFERICQLRHAAVHSDGHLNSKNLRDFGFIGAASSQSLHIDLNGLHIIAKVCDNVVRAYHRALFNRISERWKDRQLLQAVWTLDKPLYSALFNLFHSTLDDQGPKTAHKSYVLFRPSIKKVLDKNKGTV